MLIKFSLVVSSWDGPGENIVCWLIQKVRYKNMAKSSSSLVGLSSLSLAVALLSTLQNEGKTVNGETLMSLFSDARSELARQESIAMCFDTRVKAMLVDFFRGNKNSGVTGSVVIQKVAMDYVKRYESSNPEIMVAFADVTARLEDFFKHNTGSARSENAKANPKDGKAAKSVAPAIADAFLVSRGPAGVSLNSAHYESKWAHDSCLAYQELQQELAQVNNPVSDADDEGESDSEAELDSDSDSDSESVLA